MTPPTPAPPLLPLYHRAYLLLVQRLQSQSPDARLPGEHGLAAELGISRMTLRRALARLEAEGRITRRRGDGTRLRAAWDGGAGTDTVTQLLRIAGKTETVVLSLEDVPATADVAAALSVAPGAPVHRAAILRRLGTMPVSHLSACFARSAATQGLSASLLAAEPLLTVTERLLGPVVAVRQGITAVLADAPLAGKLAVEAGTPLMRIARHFDGSGGTLQFSVAHYRADCFDIVTREERHGRGTVARRRCEITMRLAERD